MRYSHQIDLCIILSFRSELVYLADNNVYPDHILVLEDHFPSDDIHYFIAAKNIAVIKKFFALKYFSDQYERIAMADDEILLVDDLYHSDILRADIYCIPYHSVKGFFLERFITDPIRLVANDHHRKELIDFFVAKKLYNWYFNLPIFDCSHTTQLFEFFGLASENWYLKITYESFEYILYQYFLFVHFKSRLKITLYDWDHAFCGASGNCWESGYASSTGRRYLSTFYSDFTSLWIPSARLLSLNPNAKLIFHTDRNYASLKYKSKALLGNIKSSFRSYV